MYCVRLILEMRGLESWFLKKTECGDPIFGCERRAGGESLIQVGELIWIWRVDFLKRSHIWTWETGEVPSPNKSSVPGSEQTSLYGSCCHYHLPPPHNSAAQYKLSEPHRTTIVSHYRNPHCFLALCSHEKSCEGNFLFFQVHTLEKLQQEYLIRGYPGKTWIFHTLRCSIINRQSNINS